MAPLACSSPAGALHNEWGKPVLALLTQGDNILGASPVEERFCPPESGGQRGPIGSREGWFPVKPCNKRLWNHPSHDLDLVSIVLPS
jgi:hypothetical protein